MWNSKVHYRVHKILRSPMSCIIIRLCFTVREVTVRLTTLRPLLAGVHNFFFIIFIYILLIRIHNVQTYLRSSVRPALFLQNEASYIKMITKTILLGKTPPGKLWMLLLHARVRVHANFFPHLFLRRKKSWGVTTTYSHSNRGNETCSKSQKNYS
jgi:hypothetical protein